MASSGTGRSNGKKTAYKKSYSQKKPSKAPVKRKSSIKKKKRLSSKKTFFKLVGGIAAALVLVTLGYCFGIRCDGLGLSTAQYDTKPPIMPNSRSISQKHDRVKSTDTAKNVRKENSKNHTYPTSTGKQTSPHKKKSFYRDKTIVKKQPAANLAVLQPPIDTHRMPKLAIIIDDVHTRKQIEMIQAIGYPVTPSIFPPYSLSPHTDRLTRYVTHYMIHLPMESGSAKFNRQTGTLLRRFSADRIDRAVRKLRFEFPEARWINNHTGSHFTADKAAMERLYEALKRYDFYFLDSVTTPKSQVRFVVQAYGDVYIKRDIFLDNVQDANYIRNQLHKAVRIARKKGYAVAIGHPHPVTLRTLRASKDILKGVEVVYIDDLARSLP